MSHNVSLEFSVRKNLFSGDGPAHLAYFLICLPTLVISAIMSTNGKVNWVNFPQFSVPLRAPCMFKFLTGFNCPACGMTRSFIYMSHFNIGAAFAMNHAGPLLYALCVFEVPYRLTLLLRGHVPLQKFFHVFEILLFASFVCVDLFFFLWQFIRLL
jgi:hypothetical protein